MKTQDKYLKEMNTPRFLKGKKKNPNHIVIDLNDRKKVKKENQKKSAEKLNMKIDFLMDKVINTSNQFRGGLVTVEEYKRFLKDILKKL